ncbi:MAG: chromosome partitioning protein [Proteobacteria bacterium]|nr:MAG: chromosome partitioning protein [Pseudomonadota bacterium]
MSRVIAVANQKGGVGKTTTSVNLAASLHAVKRSVLLIDMDPQGNATTGLGLDKHNPVTPLSDVLVGDGSIKNAIQQIPDTRMSAVSGGPDLTIAEVQLMGMDEREYRLETALRSVRNDYDYVIIDCPPSLNMLTVNALVAADAVLIPMQCEYYAMEGLSALIRTIDTIRAAANPDLHICGLLRTMYDPRSNLVRDVSRELLEVFKDKVYNTAIPRNVRLAEAPSYGVPVLMYDQKSRGALAYLALAAEILRKDSEKMVAA